MGRYPTENAWVLAHSAGFLTKPMKPMVQTDLSRYDQRGTVQHDPPNPVENVASVEESAGADTGELGPDEKAILDYIEKNTHVAKSELQHRSGLPKDRLNEILASLENKGLIKISTGYTVIQIQSQQRTEGFPE